MSQPTKLEQFCSLIFPPTKFIRFGDYPAAYDPVKHGPYNPSRYYGTPDTSFGDVKLSELPAWFARREKGPRQFMGLLSRAYWRWQMAWVFPKKTTPAPVYQLIVTGMILCYTINYLRIRGHRSYKYH